MPENFSRYTVLKPADYHPKAENGVIVEVGPGEQPIFQVSERVLSRIECDALYVGIDYQRKNLDRSKRHTGTIVCGEAYALPLADGIADEIWLMNVFGGYGGRLTPRRVLNDLVRVLKPHGTIFIGETYTPANWLLQYDFQQFGLRRQILMDTEADSFIEFHGITRRIAKAFTQGQGSFFMTLTR